MFAFRSFCADIRTQINIQTQLYILGSVCVRRKVTSTICMYVCMCVCVYLCMFVSVCRTMTQRACIQMPNNIIHVRCNTVQCSTIPHHTTQHLTEVPNTTRNISQCNTDTVAIAKASANTNTTRCKTIQVQRQM